MLSFPHSNLLTLKVKKCTKYLTGHNKQSSHNGPIHSVIPSKKSHFHQTSTYCARERFRYKTSLMYKYIPFENYMSICIRNGPCINGKD